MLNLHLVSKQNSLSLSFSQIASEDIPQFLPRFQQNKSRPKHIYLYRFVCYTTLIPTSDRQLNCTGKHTLLAYQVVGINRWQALNERGILHHII